MSGAFRSSSSEMNRSSGRSYSSGSMCERSYQCSDQHCDRGAAPASWRFLFYRDFNRRVPKLYRDILRKRYDAPV